MVWGTLTFDYFNIQYLIWTHVRTHPVVQVVMKALVTDAELELLQETPVIHHIKSSEGVKTSLSVKGKKNLFYHHFHTQKHNECML